LCFDEFQVTNVADAMILGRLFSELFERGVVVVATSNVAPDDLYAGGLNRELFLPFIALFKEKLDVLHLPGATDHRLSRQMALLEGMPVYHFPLGAKADSALTQAFARLTEGCAPEPDTIVVQGRRLTSPAAAGGVARFGFAALCKQALGAADYLAIAARYHTVVLSGIPRFRENQRNEARRFVTLIDALYEHKVKLVCSAETTADRLYDKGDSKFEFTRTASRLMEMQSHDYLVQPHQPPKS
jgi:cell division protein ZapE